jgi:transposase-like protein
MIGFSNRKSCVSYERTNFSELVRELSISAPLLYQWRKRVRRVWTRSFLDKGDLKQMPEQEQISELERKLKAQN